MTCHLYKKPLQMEKQLVLLFAKRTQLTLGYVFRVGVPASYFQCSSNSMIATGLSPNRYVNYTITTEGA